MTSNTCVIDIRNRQEIFEANSLYLFLIYGKVLAELPPQKYLKPIPWDFSNPLCEICKIRPIEDDNKCQICSMVKKSIEENEQNEEDYSSLNTILWIYNQNCNGIFVPPVFNNAITYQMTDNDFCIMMREGDVFPYLLSKEWKEEDNIGICVLDCSKKIENFGDFIAMMSHHAKLLNEGKGIKIKFFFTYKGARSLDIIYSSSFTFLPQFLLNILPVLRQFKNTFSHSQIDILKQIVKENKQNKIYFIGKFLSLCSPPQKKYLSEIGFFDAEPQKQISVLYLTKYVFD